jgi:hypothetical protein
MTKRLVPYAGAERKPIGKPSSKNNSLASPEDLLIAFLTDRIVRARREIKELQNEQQTLQRMLSKIRADRGAIV